MSSTHPHSLSSSARKLRLKKTAALLLTAALLAFIQPASALDLLQTWQAASRYDPQLVADHAGFEAGQARRDQSRSLWLPNVELNATAGRATNETSMKGAQFSAPGFGQSTGVEFDTSVRSGTLERYAITARQPLIDEKRLAQSRQLTLSADMAGIEWSNAQQALMLRAAEHYFDMLLANQTLQLLLQQEGAVQQTLIETRDRFRLGDVPIIDTHEASARAEAIKAQVMMAQTDVQIKEAAFFNLTGQKPIALVPLGAKSDAIPSLALAPLDEWTERAIRHNPSLQIQAKGQELAQQETVKHSARAAPTLDLVGSASHERLQGGGNFGSAANKSNNWMVGVQLSIPIFTGGYRSAKYQEALHLRDKTRADGRYLRQQVELQVRAAWLGLSTGQSRILALKQALIASEARLGATQLGRSIGDRNTLELLDAQNAATAARLALTQTRIALVLDRLRLAALAGSLNEEELRSVNGLLQAKPAR